VWESVIWPRRPPSDPHPERVAMPAMALHQDAALCSPHARTRPRRYSTVYRPEGKTPLHRHTPSCCSSVTAQGRLAAGQLGLGWHASFVPNHPPTSFPPEPSTAGCTARRSCPWNGLAAYETRVDLGAGPPRLRAAGEGLLAAGPRHGAAGVRTASMRLSGPITTAGACRRDARK
jgi:hypothetical protein